MPINVKCPYCEKIISARDELAGQKVDCPNCRTQLDVPKEPWPSNTEPPRQKAANHEGPTSYYIDACPHCGKIISAPDEVKWKKGRCPKCKKPMGLSPAELRRQLQAAREKKLLRAGKHPSGGFVAGVF